MAIKRKKPKFFRKDWNKKLRLGSKQKSKRKWKAAKGGDNKIRLKRRGYAQKVAIGWGADKKIKGKVEGFNVAYISVLKEVENVKKGEAIIINKNMGKRKRKEIIDKANQKGIKILNKYRKKNDAISK
ncbi:MAG: eL32 family ribosomal protein [Nanoarchaeota archaeon]|nr:eL32 family ribosomal protein [Nanoarchaeota archaeon]